MRLLFLLAYAVAFAASPPSLIGLIPVSSSYTDTITKKQITFTGSGTVFSLANTDGGTSRLFVLTAAHVSQGNSLQLDGKAVSILGRLANNDADIEVIEINPGLYKPLGTWSNEYKKIFLDAQGLSFWTHSSNPLRKPARSANHIDLEFPRGRSAFTLRGFWVKEEPIEYSQRYEDISSIDMPIYFRERVIRQITGATYSLAQIKPGMSGAPLIQPVDIMGNFYFPVGGVAIRYKRNFPGSWFAGHESISELIEDYLKGKRGLSSKTKWQVSRGITNCDFGNGRKELSFINGFAGNQETGEGGNQETGDGGSGSVHPDFWQALGIKPGVEIQNRQVIGFASQDFGAIYADADSLLFFAKNGKYKEIPLHSELTKLFLDKYSRGDREASFSGSVEALRRYREIGGTLSIYANMLFNPSIDGTKRVDGPVDIGTITKQFMQKPDFVTKVTISNTLSFEFYGPNPDREKIAFVLDNEGVLLNNGVRTADYFQPVIRVRGSRGNNYVVELQNLFFTALSLGKFSETEFSFVEYGRGFGQGQTQDSFRRAWSSLTKINPILGFRKEGDNRYFEIPFGGKAILEK